LKRYLLYILALLPAADLWPQDTRRYSFTNFGVPDGLASYEVVTSTQDPAGYIWIGTANGLQRYDGVRFRTFRHEKNDPSSIPGNYILQLLVDRSGNLWLLDGGGRVGIFDTRSFKFREAVLKPSSPQFSRAEKYLRLDEDGNILLIGRAVEMITYNANKHEFSRENNFIPIPPGWMIGDVLQLRGTSRYVISAHEGIAVYNRRTNKLSYPGRNLENEPIVENLGKTGLGINLLQDKKNRLWFDTWEEGMPALYAYDLTNNKVLEKAHRVNHLAKGYHEVRGLMQQENGSIWIHGLGIFAQYLETEMEFQGVYNQYESAQSISYSRVNDIFEDKDHNIWVSTNTNGLYRFNPDEQFFTNIRHLHPATKEPGEGGVLSFARTKKGNLLVGTWGDGLYLYDQDLNVLPLQMKGLRQLGSASAWSMFVSRDSNRILIGAQPGIMIIDQDKNTATYHTPPVLENRTVRQLVEDRFGNLWAGTQSIGLFKWSREKGSRNFDDGLVPFKEIPRTQILRITLDNQGYVWVCTNGLGLYVIDPATDKILYHFGTKEPEERRLLVDAVAAALQYDDSTIVIGAGGLHLFNTVSKKITKILNFPESIPSTIAAMERDRYGHLWISLTNGIFRINPRIGIFVHFSREDGIANDLFLLASSYTMPDGKLLFGADNQFVRFDPAKVRLREQAPDVTITGFYLLNQLLNVDSLSRKNRVELSSKQNSITIQFSGLNFNAAYAIRYFMEGLDKDWKTADKSNQAVYSYLPPGKYSFLARSVNADGTLSDHITRLVIVVRPPFWKTWWFLGLVIFAATALLSWLDKLRMQRLRATESVRSRIASSLTEDMTSSLTNINISSELARTKVDTDTRRTREYISQISEASNRMVQAMYDMVWSIDPKNDTMANTIERMKSFAAEMENSYPVHVDFDLDGQVEKINIDMEHRYELLSIYKEAVTNAIKHSDGRHVKVSLRYNKPRLVMMVVDDGRGFVMDDATMLARGISDMRRRAAGINSSLYIESEINTGTVVKLEMEV